MVYYVLATLHSFTEKSFELILDLTGMTERNMPDVSVRRYPFLWLWSPCVYAPSFGCGHLVCMLLPLVVVTLCVWLCTALLLKASASTALCCCLFSSRLLMYCLPFFVPNSWTTWSSLQCLSPSWPCLAWTRFTSTIATLLSEHWPINYLVEYSHILRYASAYGMNVGGPSRTHPFCCHVTDIGCKEGHSY